MSFLKEVLRGIAIGVANIIPGVSGGTMMVSMGIYGDVIGAVTGMPKHFWNRCWKKWSKNLSGSKQSR